MTGTGTIRPAFIQALSEAHYAELCRCVILTGNIYDLFPLDVGGVVRFESVTRALQTTLTQARYPRRGGSESFIVVVVNGGKIDFANPVDTAELRGLADSASESSIDRIDAAPGHRLATIFTAIRGND